MRNMRKPESELTELIDSNIKGERLRLVPFSMEHLDDKYVSWLNDPNIVRYSNQRFQKHSIESCKQYLKSFENTINRFWAIQKNNNGELLGTLTMYINAQHLTADIGILIGVSSNWGNGFGREAFGLAINFLLSTVKLRKVTAGTLAVNEGMIKVFKHCDMTLEATRKDQELLDGKPVDILYFSKFAA